MDYQQKIMSLLSGQFRKNSVITIVAIVIVDFLVVFFGDKALRPNSMDEFLAHPAVIFLPYIVIVLELLLFWDYKRSCQLAKESLSVLITSQLIDLYEKLSNYKKKKEWHSELIYTDNFLIVNEPLFVWKFINWKEVTQIKTRTVTFRGTTSYHLTITIKGKKVNASFPSEKERTDLIKKIADKNDFIEQFFKLRDKL